MPFAVIGMGRLGGAELSYASDIDVMFVYDGDCAADFDAAEHVAALLVQEIGATTAEGQTFRIDARLRPEGNQGPLARSLGGFAPYYEHYGLTWERQALSKARFVAGAAELGARFCELVGRLRVRAAVHRRRRARGPPHEGAHRTRAHPARRGPAVPPQARRGSLSDVEFTVQLLQLVHGGEHPTCAAPAPSPRSTGSATPDLLDADDADVLEEAYRFCERARNALYLQTAQPSDSLPADKAELERLGLLLGYVRQPHSALRDDYRRVTRRARRVVERVFYDA